MNDAMEPEIELQLNYIFKVGDTVTTIDSSGTGAKPFLQQLPSSDAIQHMQWFWM